jgi:16S rRNA G966 N2-methylase RsmD
MSTEYALLAHPGHNKVYFEQSQPLHLLELQAVAGDRCADAAWRDLGGVPWLTFRCDALDDRLRRDLESLSYFYCLFALRDGALTPLEPLFTRYLSAGMATMLKYSGKTNEQFTALMINLAASLCATGSPRLRLLDPMSGKGTTLWEALSRGMDAAGVEVNAAWHQEASAYAVKFLENARLKHKAERSSVPGEKGKRLADVLTVRFANSREAWEADDAHTLTLVNADTQQAHRCLKPGSFDILVADLPYGIQHAGKQAAVGGKTQAQSDLKALLGAVLPAWAALLKPGGAAVFSFNTHTLSVEAAAELCQRHGLVPQLQPPYAGYAHRVDQGIRRDLVAAIKPKT